jgi:hypothetical protein
MAVTINLVDLRERIALGEPLTTAQRDWLLDVLRVPAGVSLKNWGSAQAFESIARAKAFYPMLAGINPDMVGAILADLLSTWVLGFSKEARATILTQHLKAVLALIHLGPPPDDEGNGHSPAT